MAEVHPDPAVALSDAAQQMNLQQFDEFYDSLQKFMKTYEIQCISDHTGSNSEPVFFYSFDVTLENIRKLLYDGMR